jgi:hypothetical protein
MSQIVATLIFISSDKETDILKGQCLNNNFYKTKIS